MSNVSVVMAVYNGERYLLEQVESVLAELVHGDELIIIDDASFDNSIFLLRSLRSPALKIYNNSINSGVIASFDRGLRIASNEFVFLCDQDDIWLQGKRSAFVTAFENDPLAMVVVSDVELIDASGVVTAASFMATRGGFRGSLFSTFVRNRYLGCAMAVRRELLVAALPIPPFVPMHDMWLGALGRILGEVHYIPAPTMQYRRHGGNVSPSLRQGWWRILRWRFALLAALVFRFGAISLGRHSPPTDPT